MSQPNIPPSPRDILAGKDIIGFNNSPAAQPDCGEAEAGTTSNIKSSLAKSGKAAPGNAFARQAPRP